MHDTIRAFSHILLQGHLLLFSIPHVQLSISSRLKDFIKIPPQSARRDPSDNHMQGLLNSLCTDLVDNPDLVAKQGGQCSHWNITPVE